MGKIKNHKGANLRLEGGRLDFCLLFPNLNSEYEKFDAPENLRISPNLCEIIKIESPSAHETLLNDAKKLASITLYGLSKS